MPTKMDPHIGMVSYDVDLARRTLLLVHQHMIEFNPCSNELAAAAIQLVIDSLGTIRTELDAAEVTHRIVPKSAP
jgi:hypothetical protein